MLSTAGLSVGCLLALGQPVAAAKKAEQGESEKEKEETKVSAPEDLMREHDVLHRILLIYERITRYSSAVARTFSSSSGHQSCGSSKPDSLSTECRNVQLHTDFDPTNHLCSYRKRPTHFSSAGSGCLKRSNSELYFVKSSRLLVDRYSE
jgi:hypothetical protein